MGLSQTLNLILQSAQASITYIVFGAFIAVLLIGILSTIGDWWDRRRDREDESDE
jgi:4-hydroxybenzoate polyprenyltransferase